MTHTSLPHLCKSCQHPSSSHLPSDPLGACFECECACYAGAGVAGPPAQPGQSAASQIPKASAAPTSSADEPHRHEQISSSSSDPTCESRQGGLDFGSLPGASEQDELWHDMIEHSATPPELKEALLAQQRGEDVALPAGDAQTPRAQDGRQKGSNQSNGDDAYIERDPRRMGGGEPPSDDADVRFEIVWQINDGSDNYDEEPYVRCVVVAFGEQDYVIKVTDEQEQRLQRAFAAAGLGQLTPNEDYTGFYLFPVGDSTKARIELGKQPGFIHDPMLASYNALRADGVQSQFVFGFFHEQRDMSNFSQIVSVLGKDDSLLKEFDKLDGFSYVGIAYADDWKLRGHMSDDFGSDWETIEAALEKIGGGGQATEGVFDVTGAIALGYTFERLRAILEHVPGFTYDESFERMLNGED